ncbi:hypothetical protein [Carboxylicivirga sp. M1479]|uniref:hypothetical protein n=1 Tax=Carboxylicivirga sp. M1479 TaxID=2594476 RepID=UPI0011783352|nr:hypothetical protein [Carboxylicivirga sp. M1479]TRX66132.1 hypothetical protein FNN09_15130 [Carboxylicivirga sp. M1479]
MKYTLLFLALLSSYTTTIAQTVKAITQHGETVVLYENGTWKYEKDVQLNNTPATTPAVVAEAAVLTDITIDNTKEVTSEKQEVFNAVSKKLSRFFGDEKGKIHCSATATNTKGKITLNFEFMVPVGDANRYFGYSAQDRIMSFKLSDGTILHNAFTDNVEQNFIEKWNISYYKASIVLSKDDVNKLMQQSAISMSIDWKKTEEEYSIDKVKCIQHLLKEVI